MIQSYDHVKDLCKKANKKVRELARITLYVKDFSARSLTIVH